VSVAPDVFDLDDDDVLVYQPDPGPEHDESVRAAAAVCPAQAIRILGAAT
jgi:ferredoxin